MKRGSLFFLGLMLLYAIACADADASNPPGNGAGPDPTLTIVWPTVQDAVPDSAAPGQSVRVIGSGGYHILPDGGYDESSRPFALYFDDVPASSITCYANRCEGDLVVPREAVSGTHRISTDGGSELSLRVVESRVRVFLPLLQCIHELTCDRERAELSITCKSGVRVGDPLTVTLTLENLGCLALGLPLYRLYVDPVGEASPFSALPEPVEHYLGVSPGGKDEATFVLYGSRPGEVQIRGSASYEVHLGYPGPAYWASASSAKVPITVYGEGR